MFKHFILTRFNLKLEGIPKLDKNNKPVQTEEWLEERFNLFEKYCLPSIMAQTCKKFVWFVMFDTNTPGSYIKKINKYESLFPLLIPLFLEKGDSNSIKTLFNQEKNKYLDVGTKYIITTRIDNDDAFHQDMIHEVQEQFNCQQNVVISFTHGMQYDLRKQILTQLHYGDNHFISRIEKVSNCVETVITYDHTYISKVAEVTYIENKYKPMWIEIIHEGNLINSLYPTSVPKFCGKLFGAFNLEAELSVINTFLLFIKFLKLKVLILRTDVLKRIGIYEFIKKIVKK